MAEAAASDMRRRIPSFSFVYVSPHHFRDRGSDIWYKLQIALLHRGGVGGLIRALAAHDGTSGGESDGTYLRTERSIRVLRGGDGGEWAGRGEIPDRPSVWCTDDHLDIRVSRGAALVLATGGTNVDIDAEAHGASDDDDDGHADLLRLSSDLRRVQRAHLWKCTVGQSKIGRDGAETAEQVGV